MKLRSLLEDLNYKQEALHFQRLMLENEWIEDLDIELEHFSDQDGDHFNAHVKHPEFFDLTFHVDEEFSISHETADEPYGRTAEKAYHAAMPILLGMAFGRAAVNKRKGAAVEDYELATDNGSLWSSFAAFLAPLPKSSATGQLTCCSSGTFLSKAGSLGAMTRCTRR